MSYSKRVHKATFKKRIKAARVKLDKVRRAPIPHKFRATMAQTAGIAKATYGICAHSVTESELHSIRRLESTRELQEANSLSALPR